MITNTEQRECCEEGKSLVLLTRDLNVNRKGHRVRRSLAKTKYLQQHLHVILWEKYNLTQGRYVLINNSLNTVFRAWDACSSGRSDGCAGRRRTGTLPLSRHANAAEQNSSSAEDIIVYCSSGNWSEIWDLTQFKVTVEHCFATHVVLVGNSLCHAVIILQIGAVDGPDKRLTQMQLVDLTAATHEHKLSLKMRIFKGGLDDKEKKPQQNHIRTLHMHH